MDGYKQFEDVATVLATITTRAAFDFWEDKVFRDMVNFNSLNKEEQDRIFNELEVTVLGLVALYADAKPLLLPLQKETVDAFIKIMEDQGIEEEHLSIWRLLIKMRFKEYKRDFRLSLRESRDWEELEGEDAMRLIWARVETLTINGLSHIRHGKVEKEDPLWRYLRKWLAMLEVVFSESIQKVHLRIPMGIC